MNLLWLGDPQSFDEALVGGKAANLSRLAHVYPRVPDGFCLPVTLMDQGHPFDLQAEIAHAISDLMGCHRLPELVVAVRSSAVEEDSSLVSFAGMHETYLNVSGTEAILQAIVRCWESARSGQALEYRRQRGLSLENVQLAVLVQQLIVADVSIVAFSMNPVTLDRTEVMINASWGLGASLVSGTVTPDTFVVRKSDLAVTSRNIAEKRCMTVAVSGGTREVDVPRFLQSEACLSDEQLIEVAQLVLSLEKTMGYAVDVECAYASGKLYLLQCRPITTLK